MSFVTITAPATASPAKDDETTWIALREGKEWSRLLYPNPVCFLCTTTSLAARHPETTATTTATTTANADFRNVMVLSWLTATNNEGAFCFSISKHRFTASVLSTAAAAGHSNSNSNSNVFTLSVPVQGMEELVRRVGSVSGRWGVSKFPSDHEARAPSSTAGFSETASDPAVRAIAAAALSASADRSSTRKKPKRPRFPQGIPGLAAVPFGSQVVPASAAPGAAAPTETTAFGIQGSVAQLLCRVHSVIEGAAAGGVDEDHLLVFCQVQQACVHPAYWNGSKKLFQPQLAPAVPPYLTFFGSQTFGYVSAEPLDLDTTTVADAVVDNEAADGTELT
jgi:flavin reductase (DIM6/NTAB) family NADH-FMN oxidoreductase RutF